MDEATAWGVVVDIMRRATQAVDMPPPADETRPKGTECTNTGGHPTGQIQLGNTVQRTVSRDAGVADLHTLRQLWLDSGYRLTGDANWDDPFITLFFRDDKHRIRISANVNTAGQFSIAAYTDCMQPDETATTKSTSRAAGPTVPGDDGGLTRIRDVLG